MKTRFYLLLSLSVLLLISGCSGEPMDKPPAVKVTRAVETSPAVEPAPVLNENKPDLLKLDSDQVSILAVGDIMVHESQWIAQSREEGCYDFRNNFIHVSDLLSSSDLSIANLETTINDDKPVTTYPRFNSPDALLDAMKEAGFNLISTANNHSMDTGLEGIFSTLSELEERDLEAIGTSKDSNAKRHVLKEIKGMKLGISSFSTAYFNEKDVVINNIHSMGMEKHVNYMELTDSLKAFRRLKKEIDAMKEEGAEFIILILHWGNEYEKTANAYQKDLAQRLIDEGVGLILGSHPHMVQEMEYLSSSDGTREGLVVYSLGNFLSNQRNEILNMTGTEDGLISRVVLQRDESGRIIIGRAQYVPTWVNRIESGDSHIYEILPIYGEPEETAARYHAEEEKIRTSLNNTQRVMTDSRITHLSLED
jgi:poly-gamma-glutamate synthesis protein (capsule biosynthesis protein)